MNIQVPDEIFWPVNYADTWLIHAHWAEQQITCRAMEAAVFLLSPVSRITSRPILFSVYTARCASGFTMSATLTMATNMPANSWIAWY